MRIRTVICYLAGIRYAILELASNRWSLVVGVMFLPSGASSPLSCGENERYAGPVSIALELPGHQCCGRKLKK
jgi:hypothetical protein